MNRADYLRWASHITPESLPGAVRLKVAILASCTVDFWKPYLVMEAARRGMIIEPWIAPFGQVEQQTLNPGSELYGFRPDVVILLTRLEDMDPELAWNHLRFDAEGLVRARQTVAGHLKTSLEAVRGQCAARIVTGNFTRPAWSPVGQADGSAEFSQAGSIQRLNEEVAAACRSIPDCAVLDVARLAGEVGLARWRDERLAWMAKAPHSHEAMVALAVGAARQIRPWFLPPKKCLVLDMDNTVWGGVVGEDGMEGIQMGQDYPGNVFCDFQRRVLALRDQGVLLAAASKNNSEDVEKVLQEHPACLLKREHFAAFEVHWEDKATSLRRIAQTLNIGTDALVFFDDNPVEREWVRAQMPEVTVLEVPASPMGYGGLLENCGCFDVISLTTEDRKRAELYEQGAVRDQLRSSSGSLEEFLRGLGMVLTVGRVDAATLPRVAQLLAKTNQFNLTTRRHGSAEIQAMLDEGGIGIWVRVADRFGDSGLTGVALARPLANDSWVLDSFLLSCRVMGRQVETAMLACVEKAVMEKGGRSLTGEFFPTAKNQPAADFFERHGYRQDGDGLWRTSLDAPRCLPDHLTLEVQDTHA